MDLATRLHEDMKAAMKAGDRDRLSVIRMMLSDVRNIDLDPKKPTAEHAVEAYAKRLRKSLEEFEKLGKTAESDKLRAEIAVAEGYLPRKASREETERLVDAFLAANPFTAKQMGQAMGAFMKQHGGSVDAGTVNQLLKARLQ